MKAWRYVDPAGQYELAAEYCAKQGYSDPMLVRALLDLPESVMECIEADPDKWARRVSEYAYGHAMTLAEQVADAQRVMATWIEEKKRSVQLEGSWN